EDGIRDLIVTGVQTCALPISQHKLTERLRLRLNADDHASPVRRDRLRLCAVATIRSHNRNWNPGTISSLHVNAIASICRGAEEKDRKSTRLNSSHDQISYAVF